jgi:hypothetical protein
MKYQDSLNRETRLEFASLARQWAKNLLKIKDKRGESSARSVEIINSWADSLEHAIVTKAERTSNSKPKSKGTTKRTSKETLKRR